MSIKQTVFMRHMIAVFLLSLFISQSLWADVRAQLSRNTIYDGDTATLVIESTYTEDEAEMAARFGHLTAAQAAKFAIQAGVQQLLLTHISRRYRERDVLAEAQSIFPNSLVARDFDAFQIRRGECLKVKA